MYKSWVPSSARIYSSYYSSKNSWLVWEMNELDLIKEVQKRPILYDKSLSGFKKTKLRNKAWKEVHDSLNSSGK